MKDTAVLNIIIQYRDIYTELLPKLDNQTANKLRYTIKRITSIIDRINHEILMETNNGDR